MKVFIKSSTGDFLLEHAWRGYGFYKYTIGLDTRGDLDQEGGHCVDHFSGMRTALDWFTGRTDIPEEPFMPHWSRVNSSDDIMGLALEDTGAVWMVTREFEPDGGALWVSLNLGESWEEINRLAGTPGELGGGRVRRNGGMLAAQNGMLFALQDGELRRSLDGGASFGPVGSFDYSNHIVIDGRDSIYRDGDAGIQRSIDGGNSWFSFDVGRGWSLRNTDLVLDIDNPKIVVHSNPGFILNLASAGSDSLKPVHDTSLGQPFQAAWDGETLWSLARTENFRYRLFSSGDEGGSWQQVDLPDPANDYWNFDSRVTALGRGRILIRGAWNSAWISQDGGLTWDRVPGLETGDGGWVTASGTEAFFTDGQGAFRLELEED